MKKFLLPATVFITGASVLIIEVVATRILSPFFGNTIFTVSSVIGTILAALSIGYAIGGRIADHHPTHDWFFGLIALSGVTSLLCYDVSLALLPAISRSFSIMSGPLIASMAFFFLPCLLLGTLSPYAIVIQKQDHQTEGVGDAAGRIFFWSTLGSIAGSLATGFLLIPSFGIKTIMLSNGIILCLIGSVPYIFLNTRRNYRIFIIGTCLVIIAISLGLMLSVRAAPSSVYDQDGIYEHIRINNTVLNHRPARTLKQDHTDSGAIYLDTEDPFDVPYAYAKYAEAYKLVRDDAKRILTIGGGTYTVARMYASRFPNADIDAVEIEPSLSKLAEQYFGLTPLEHLHLITEDGRRYLERSSGSYDIIFSDVYQSFVSIPSHMTTEEFFKIAKSKLSPNGIFIANIIGDPTLEKPSLFFSEIRTMKQAFPNMLIAAVEDPNGGPQNFIFMGFNREEPVDVAAISHDQTMSPFVASIASHVFNFESYDLNAYQILTDNYAPTEYLTALMIQRVESRLRK